MSMSKKLYTSSPYADPAGAPRSCSTPAIKSGAREPAARCQMNRKQSVNTPWHRNIAAQRCASPSGDGYRTARHVAAPTLFPANFYTPPESAVSTAEIIAVTGKGGGDSS